MNIAPASYLALAYWHLQSGSHHHYIKTLQARASQESQPTDVLYRQENGVWRKLSDLNLEHPFREAFRKWDQKW